MNQISLIPKPFTTDTTKGAWAITIGNFDGFHLGHQALVQRVINEKNKFGTKAGLLTFSPHPRQVLQPDNPPPMIYNEDQKWDFCKKLGLDSAFAIPFNKEFASLSPEDFIQNYLFEPFQLKKIIVGYDFNFGRKREGSSNLLEQMAKENQIEFEKFGPFQVDSVSISSTFVRKLLLKNQFQQAEQALGRRWSITGIVEQGKQLGRTIGFPTINIYPSIRLPIQNGVYICEVKYEDQLIHGICNIGVRPTIANNQKLSVETHLFDFQDEIYGETVEVFPIQFIRPEQAFPNLEHLQQQIQEDLKIAKSYFC